MYRELVTLRAEIEYNRVSVMFAVFTRRNALSRSVKDPADIGGAGGIAGGGVGGAGSSTGSDGSGTRGDGAVNAVTAGGARDDGRNEGDGSTGMERDKGAIRGDACGVGVVVGVDGKGGDGGAVEDVGGVQERGKRRRFVSSLAALPPCGFSCPFYRRRAG
jgi:hypothetical protein